VAIFKTFCSSGAIGASAQRGACAHGLGHAMAIAAGHDMMDGMTLCIRTFEGVPGMQHRCGTGVGMQLKELVVDPVSECGRLPLPAGCFEYAFTKRPKYQESSHFTSNKAFVDSLVTWGRATRHTCSRLERSVQREACVFGIMATISGDLKRARPTFQKHGADNIESYMRTVFGNSAAETCGDTKSEVQTACIYGWLRYSIQALGENEAPRVICNAIQENPNNGMPLGTCLGNAHKYIQSADAVQMHYLIIEP